MSTVDITTFIDPSCYRCLDHHHLPTAHAGTTHAATETAKEIRIHIVMIPVGRPIDQKEEEAEVEVEEEEEGVGWGDTEMIVGEAIVVVDREVGVEIGKEGYMIPETGREGTRPLDLLDH